MPADQHRLGRGLEERAVTGGKGGEHSARWNGEWEVPGRGHHDHAERLHLAPADMAGSLFERAGVVAGEIDGLRDLGIRLRHGLGTVDDHRADEVAAPAGEHGRGLVEDRAAL